MNYYVDNINNLQCSPPSCRIGSAITIIKRSGAGTLHIHHGACTQLHIGDSITLLAVVHGWLVLD